MKTDNENQTEEAAVVCSNCKYFDPCMWQGDDDRLLGTCHDAAKIIHYKGTVVNHDNAPAIIDANKQTCFNHTPNAQGEARR